MYTVAVILAGGSGKRVGGDLPKQLLPLKDGRTVLQTAVDAFRACPCIDEVLVVMHPDYVEEMSALLQCPVIPGGKERWESSWNAIQYISTHQSLPSHHSLLPHQSLPLEGESEGVSPLGESEGVRILLHDAARPFVSPRIIEEVCAALESHEAVTVAVPATDTMYRVVGNRLAEIPDRTTMMRAQTPQAFHLDIIRKAYQLAVKDPHLQATDDCGIVHKYLPEVPICIVEGDEQNRKLTFKEDFSL